MVEIILTDWIGYPLRRKKRIKRNVVKCGISGLLESMANYDPGLTFNCTLIINGANEASENSHYCLPRPAFPHYQTNSKKTYLDLAEKYPFINEVLFRDNSGFDIGAYDFGINRLRQKNYNGDVLLMNSSVAPSSTDGWLEKYHRLFYKYERAGLCGIFLNSHNTCLKPPLFSPHVQSFFLFTNMEVLNMAIPRGLQLSALTQSNKDELVEQGEIGISRKILDAGFGIIASTFPEFIYFNGSDWNIPEGDIRSQKAYRALANKM